MLNLSDLMSVRPVFSCELVEDMKDILSLCKNESNNTFFGIRGERIDYIERKNHNRGLRRLDNFSPNNLKISKSTDKPFYIENVGFFREMNPAKHRYGHYIKDEEQRTPLGYMNKDLLSLKLQRLGLSY